VMYDNGRYRMWFSGVQNNDLNGGAVPDRGEYIGAIDQLNLQGIAYSESNDGLTWSDPKNLTNNIDLQIEPSEGAWDKYGLETCTVVKNPRTNVYYLYYTGKTTITVDTRTCRYFSGIGCATSMDGIAWVKSGAVITSEYQWEKPYYNSQWYKDAFDAGNTSAAGGVLEPTVIFDENENVFKMWYAGMGESEAGNGATWGVRMGYATSADGIAWTKRSQCIFDRGPAGTWEESWTSHYHVIKDPGEGYHLFYAGQNNNTSIYAIGHAYSVDGITWLRNPNNPLVANTAGSWHEKMTGGPSVIIKDGLFQLWFFGSRLDNFSFVFFGYATAGYTPDP